MAKLGSFFLAMAVRTEISASRILLAAAMLLLALLPADPVQAGSPSATAAERRSCGTIPTTSIYRRARVIAIRRVSCRRARQVAYAYDRHQRFLGRWRCGLAHGDRPRLFSCGAGPPRTGDLRRRRYALEAVGSGGRKSGASASRVHRCRNRVGPTITITSTRNMLCRSAVRVMRAHNRPIPGSFRTSGYRCRRISGSRLGGTWRCARSNRAFRFSFGD
ncbi:MAG: hypothetical protein M3131_04075 [Actinomycetota bacterium]|nr:hypothetical protein [Actinomycetota bacterium]